MLLPLVTEKETVAQSGTMKLNSDGSLSDFTFVLLPLGCVHVLTGRLPDSEDRIFFLLYTPRNSWSLAWPLAALSMPRDWMKDGWPDWSAPCWFPAALPTAAVFPELHVL